jgi:hypothetical protein
LEINTRRKNEVGERKGGRQGWRNMHNRCMLSRGCVSLPGVRVDQTQHANVRPPMSKQWKTSLNNTHIQILWDTTLSTDKQWQRFAGACSSTSGVKSIKLLRKSVTAYQ